MDDGTAASAGFVLAAVAAAAALGDGDAARGLLPAGLAAVAFVGFALRRYGRLDRRRGALLAGLASLAAAVAAGAILVAPELDGPGPGTAGATWLTLAAVAGLGGVTAAYADGRGIPRERLVVMARATLLAVVLGFAGLVAIVAWGGVVGTVLHALHAGELPATLRIAASTVALGLGTGSVAAGYLAIGRLDWRYVDVRRPTLRDLGVVVGSVLLILAINLGIGLLFARFGVDSATHSVVRTARSDPQILLVLVPLSYLVIAPGEELLYRNVVQKSLYGTFSRRGAVVVASGVFALAHIFAYADPDGGALATVTTLVVIFALSIVLGAAYERTGNLVVPALVHGTFNAIAFAATYVELTGGAV